MTTAEPRRFAIRHDPVDYRKTTIKLDGVDIAPLLSSYQMTAIGGNPFPTVVLTLHPAAANDATWDGFAHVAIGEDPDPGPAAAAFLAAIDPETLETSTLQRDDLEGGPGALTAAMLRQLGDWANGRP